MALTKKQRLFVEEYLIDLNATQAAIRAGYSPKTAKDIGCENLAKPNIKAEIDKEMAERSRRTGVNADRVIQELAKLAFVNVGEIVDLETGEVKCTVTEEDLACIQSVKVKPGEWGTEREIKFHDKKSSLELLGKHLGMWTDKVDMTADLNIVFEDDYGD